MKNIKKVAAGVIAGAAIATAPLVAFAAPAFAAAGPGGTGGPHNSPEQHVLVDHAGGQSNAPRMLGDFASAGSLRDGNAARCGGGINC